MQAEHMCQVLLEVLQIQCYHSRGNRAGGNTEEGRPDHTHGQRQLPGGGDELQELT